MSEKKTYCFDIDGTLCSNTEGEYLRAKPFLNRIAIVNRLFREGHEILLLTARGATTGINWRKSTEKQLKEWGVHYHKLYLNKPAANFYVDDKGFNSETWDWNKNINSLNTITEKSILEDAAYLKVTYNQKEVPFGPYPSQLASWLNKHVLPSTGRILDMGTGRGEFLEAFSKLGFTVAGVDISPSASSFSPSFDVRTANLDVQPMPFEKESFDIIFSKSVIEHTHMPTTMLRKALDVLVPGGVAIIMTPSWAHTYWGPFYCDHTHVTPFTNQSLRGALELVGFKDIKVQNFIQLPLVWKYPFLKPVVYIIQKLRIPFRPHKKAPWPEKINKFIRFSSEVMLLAIAKKPQKETIEG